MRQGGRNLNSGMKAYREANMESTPNHRRTADWWMQLQFLGIVRSFAPEMLLKLSTQVFPFYAEFTEKCLLNSPSRFISGLEGLSYHLPRWEEVERSNEAAALRAALLQLSLDYNLNADWCRRQMVEAMRAWVCDKESRELLWWTESPIVVIGLLFPQKYPEAADLLSNRKWRRESMRALLSLGIFDGAEYECIETTIVETPSHTKSAPVVDTNGRLVGRLEDGRFKAPIHLFPPQGLPRYDPEETSREEYLSELKARFRQDLQLGSFLNDSMLCDLREDFIKQAVKRVDDLYCGLIENHSPLSERRKLPNRPALLRHLCWTARVRVLCINGNDVSTTFARIAKEENLDVRAIKKAVRKILNTVDLPLAPTFYPNKGFPKGLKLTEERRLARK
jgi:hypothetical protein